MIPHEFPVPGNRTKIRLIVIAADSSHADMFFLPQDRRFFPLATMGGQIARCFISREGCVLWICASWLYKQTIRSCHMLLKNVKHNLFARYPRLAMQRCKIGVRGLEDGVVWSAKWVRSNCQNLTRWRMVMIYLPTMINSSHEKILLFFLVFNMLRMDFKPNYVTIINHMTYIEIQLYYSYFITFIIS